MTKIEAGRPNYIAPNPDGMPEELKAIHRWVVWQTVFRDGKPTKRPYQVNGIPASVTDCATWSEYKNVKAAMDKFDGIGFVLTDDDDIIGLDFDKCRCPGLDSVDDRISRSLDMVLPEIAKHLRNLNAYTEVSPSARIVSDWLKGPLPVDG